MSKPALRAEARRRLRGIPPGARAAADAEIARRVWAVPEIAGARALLLFASLPEEVATDDIAREALRRGITPVYPRSLGEGAMTLHAVRDLADLRPGRYGIREPDADACPVVEVSAVDAALVPGLAWDRAGHRLGRGGGYYDRLLSHPDWRAFRCGVFFAAQEVPPLPAEEWDSPLDAVLTEREMLHFRASAEAERTRAAGRALRRLGEDIRETWRSDLAHVERLTLVVAAISHALAEAGMRATLVGGGAIEFYAAGAYQTGDVDLVVEGKTRAALGEVMAELGFDRKGRHWVMDDLYVEVPGSRMTEAIDVVSVGAFKLRVIRREYLLGERIVGFRHWKAWAYGLQAIAMMAVFRHELDDELLRKWLRSEGAEDAYDLLRGFASSGIEVSTDELDKLWHQHYR